MDSTADDAREKAGLREDGEAVQETLLNDPPAEQVAVPPPEYPASQVTSKIEPVVPEIEPEAAKSELATCVLVQVFAVQETALNDPPVEQVALPPPEYPALQVTSKIEPVVPEIEPEAAKSELATCVLVQVFAVQLSRNDPRNVS